MPRTALSLLLALTACQSGIATVGDPGEPSAEDPTSPGDPSGETELLPPTAQIAAEASAEVGAPFVLDGSGSSDPQGLDLTGYAWACSDGSAASGDVATFAFAEPGDVTCALTVTSASGLTDTAEAIAEVTIHVAAWTFLVYLNGDNNLEDAALGDVDEMEIAGSTDDVNIVVQIDRSRWYDRSDGDWSGARRYRVERDGETGSIASTPLAELGQVDSGDPATIAEFVAWAAEEYPAERTALVLWNHGWGWSATTGSGPATLKGISDDEGSGNDISIAEGELEELLDAVTATLGGRLALFGMDACVMQSWEIAHVVAPYADVYVASQDYEDWDGWAYDTALSDLVASPQMTGAELGEVIAERFYESGDATQSVVDLAAVPALSAAIDALAGAILDAADPASELYGAAQDAQEFDYGWGVDHDLGDFLDRLADGTEDPAVQAAALDARDALGAAILANYTNGRSVQDASGLSIYTPTYGRPDPLYANGTWAEDTRWDDLVLGLR